MPSLRVMVALVVVLGLAACQSEDDRPATYTYIQAAILAPHCATIGCHSEYGDVRGYHFDVYDEAYRTLTGAECGAPVLGSLVVPGMPGSSFLVAVMRGGNGVKRQMPPDRPLPEKDIELIEQWILEGATCE